MNRDETMAAFQRIGEHCKARGYHYRMKGLREHWARARAGEDLGDFAKSLLEGFQLAPFERALETRPRGSRCPSCVSVGLYGGVHTLLILEDRAVHYCAKCSARWIEPVDS